MILYHGTAYGEQIIKDGIIKKDIKRNYENLAISGINLSTTNNYVYLTDSICYACKYGNDMALDEDPFFYIFKLDIPESILLADEDEIIMKNELWNREEPMDNTYRGSLLSRRSVRVNQDLVLKDYNSEYIRVESTISDTVSEDLDKILRFFINIRKVNLEEDAHKKGLFEKYLSEFYQIYQWQQI